MKHSHFQRAYGVLFLLIAGLSLNTPAKQAPPSMRQVDRVRLAETFRLARSVGDRIWPGWTQAPFAVLLVTPDREFLVHHPTPSADFIKLGFDDLLKSDVYYRPRKFPTSFLATFPAVSGSMISTIVVGQAENTWVKTSTPWVITLLHEHFHQLQDSQPSFYTDVNALNLTRGDQTGMWMLNFPFPYEQKEVQDQFVVMSKRLSEAVQSPPGARPRNLRKYLEARQRFRALITADDEKYISFQFWKEGIARYTEYHAARLAALHFRPSKDYRALRDYRSFQDVARTIRDGILSQLLTQKLGESKREVVYSFGAAEGLLLDKVRPGWRKRYFENKFNLGELLN